MRAIVITITLTFLVNLAHSQAISSEVKIYNVKIYFKGIKKPIKGIFFTYSDSTVSIINSKSITAISEGSYEQVDFLINDINELRIRRKGKIVSSTLIGGLVCGVSGALLGLASGDDEPGLLSFTAEEKAGILAVPLFVIGSGIGAIAGSSYTVIPIQGKSENIQLYEKKLERYAISKRNSKSHN